MHRKTRLALSYINLLDIALSHATMAPHRLMLIAREGIAASVRNTFAIRRICYFRAREA
jgi:hypothetical protein